MTEQTTTTEVEVVEDLDTTEHPVEPDATTEADVEDPEPDTFPRSVVEDLRKENAAYRTKAKDRDALAHRLHTAMVAATGRLADPSDLAFDPAHLEDDSALTAAIDDLLARKPHLASRRPRGDVAQGAITSDDTVDLAGILRSRA